METAKVQAKKKTNFKPKKKHTEVFKKALTDKLDEKPVKSDYIPPVLECIGIGKLKVKNVTKPNLTEKERNDLGWCTWKVKIKWNAKSCTGTVVDFAISEIGDLDEMQHKFAGEFNETLIKVKSRLGIDELKYLEI